MTWCIDQSYRWCSGPCRGGEVATGASKKLGALHCIVAFRSQNHRMTQGWRPKPQSSADGSQRRHRHFVLFLSAEMGLPPWSQFEPNCLWLCQSPSISPTCWIASISASAGAYCSCGWEVWTLRILWWSFSAYSIRWSAISPSSSCDFPVSSSATPSSFVSNQFAHYLRPDPRWLTPCLPLSSSERAHLEIYRSSSLCLGCRSSSAWNECRSHWAWCQIRGLDPWFVSCPDTEVLSSAWRS